MPNVPVGHESKFDSWDEFVRRAEMPESGSYGRSSRERGDWAGTNTFDEAVELARHGWTDGSDRLSQLTARLVGRLGNVSAVRRIGFDVMGPGTLDVGRYAIGHPESMMVWQPTEELTDINPSRILKVICAGTQSSSTEHECIFWRGAAAFAICDLAESQGVRCEVEIAYVVTGNRGRKAIQRVTVKRAQDPVTPDILAFALCSPASLRRMGFAVQETLPEAIRKEFGYGSGIGSYGHPPFDLESDEIGEAIYMPGMAGHNHPFANATTTVRYVIDTLREHGIEVENQ